MTPQTRRDFIRSSALAATALSLPSFAKAATPPAEAMPKIHIFSKHLQFLDYREMAKVAAEIGFDGVDLTVRPGGHVLPENVAKDLPRATDAIREAGIDASLMTTAVDDADDPLDQQTLREAARQGIEYYRMNWFRYPDGQPLPEALVHCTRRVQDLSDLNAELGLVGCYQNHAGTLVGASLWEVWQLLRGSDPEHFGVQYDIRHATVEGGRSWTNGLKLALPHIKTIVAKDFKWVLKNGGAELVNTPMGDGMVDFKTYFRILKDNKVNAPVSLHLEYDLGGAQAGKRDITVSRDVVYKAMRKDLETTKRLWTEA